MTLILRTETPPLAVWTFGDETPITLGRKEGNRVILRDEHISRFHARITRQGDRWILEDLATINGTYINSIRISTPTPLTHRDLLSLGGVKLRVHLESAEPPAPDPRREAIKRLEPGSDDWFTAVRDQLRHNHLILFRTQENGLHDELADPSSLRSRFLAQGFHRYVVLEGAAGTNEHGRFDSQMFLQDVRRRLAQAFDLPHHLMTYHSEDVSQMLKDERSSLFCIVNFDRIPESIFGVVRGFTQGEHRVLILCKGMRNLPLEEENTEDSVLRFVFPPSMWFAMESAASPTG